MVNIILNNSKPLFCEEYWAKRLTQKKLKPSKAEKVSTAFDLHEVNSFLLGKTNGPQKYINQIKSIIKTTDNEFRNLKPCPKEMTLWRGIHPSTDFPEKLKQSLNTKKGDIICMREYAFATDMKRYAEQFATSNSNNGILYQITVPKGSKLSNGNHFIFPRYSQFECTNTIETDKYKIIKLNLLQKSNRTKDSFLKKIISFFKQIKLFSGR